MSTTNPGRSVTAVLLPFTLIVFLGYSAVGLPLAVLPLQVHLAMGYSTAVAGAAVGLAPAATLLTRQIAGRLADRRGPRAGVLLGLLTAAASGPCYLLATALPPGPGLAALMAGRVVLGVGDSLFTTAVAVWMIARVGPQHAGRAMAWTGIAMYGALAVGAPAGAVLGSWAGFAGIAGSAAILPVLAIPIALASTGVPAVAAVRSSLLSVLRLIWPPGLGMVLASSGFGTIAAFLALRYAALGWNGAGLALTAFGGVYILARLFFAGLPDRVGGIGVAVACLLVEAAGLAFIAAAGSPAVALAGTALAGLGYSLVFPALGVEAVRRVPVESRGVALGAFLACFDFGLGAAGPVMGLVAAGRGLPSAFLAAAAACLLALGVVWTTRVRSVP